jgi:glycosyltransferase involved in cell wall biosynthesis
VPADFRVVAIMTSYNEEDIIVPSIRRLVNQGIGVYLIDNWSTDATWDLAGALLGKGLLGREKYPATGPSRHFDLTSLLTRVERVAGTLDADWFIHHDVDEIRASPWPSLNLLEGLYKVDRAGFNAVDHTIIEFHPVNNDYVPGADFEDSFKYFEFSKQPAHMLKISTWKNLGQPVSLAASGGHQVLFEGRRTFPYKFLLKHYPVRSQAHGEKKIFRERKSRWNSAERAMGWHYQYDHIVESHNFLCDASELRLFDEASFGANYLVQRLTGIGLLY